MNIIESTKQSLILGKNTLDRSSSVQSLSTFNKTKNGKLYDYIRFGDCNLICDINCLTPFLNSELSEEQKAIHMLAVLRTIEHTEINRSHNKKGSDEYTIYTTLLNGNVPLKEHDFYVLYNALNYIIQDIKEFGTSSKAIELSQYFYELCPSGQDNLIILKLLLQQHPNALNEIITICAGNSTDYQKQLELQNKTFQIMKLLSRNNKSITDLACLFSLNSKSNDITLENTIVYNTFTSHVLKENPSCIFVINPTPFFIRKYLSDDKLVDTTAFFFIADESIPYIFTRTNPHLTNQRFLNLSELHEYIESGWTPCSTLIFGNHFSSQAEKNNILSFLISSYKEKSSLFIFDFDNPIESPKFETHELLSSIDINTILLFPSGLRNCTSPQRKMLAVCEYGEQVKTDHEIALSQFKLINTKTFQALSCKTITSALSKEEFSIAPQSIRNQFRKTSESILKRTDGTRNPASSFHYSSEIEIFYTVSENKDSDYIRLRAYCRDPNNSQLIKSSIVSTKKCKLENIQQWLSTVYPFSTTKYKGEKLSVRDVLSELYRQYLKGNPITLKTFLYIYKDIPLPSYASQLFPQLSSYFGDCVLSSISSTEIEEYVEATENDASARFSPSQIKAVLSRLFELAIAQGHCIVNPINQISPAYFNDKTALYEVRQNLTKKFFLNSEIKLIIAICNDKLSIGAYEYLGVLIRLFTGLDSNTISGLKWKDFRKVTYKGHSFYQLVIRRCVNNGGTAFVPFNKVESFRFIPCISTLAKILLTEYNRQLQSVFNGNNSIMADYAIVPGNDIRINGKFFILSPQKLNKLCRKVIKELNIDPDIIPLPDDSTGYTETNLSFYGGDIFSENFRHQLVKQVLESAELPLETELFSNGEFSYLLGNKADSTFFNHYCDLGREDSQATLYSKLTMAWEEISK